MLLAETELALGAEHPLRFEAVDLLGRHGAEAWQCRAGGREGRPDPGARVGGAAHDIEPLRAAAAHAAEQQPVAAALAELPLDGLDLADDHAPQALGQQRRDARHLDAGVHETIGGVLGGELDVHELAHPAVRDLHANWLKKRRSFSKNSRMSSTPYFSIAMRSMPMPKAQPVTSSGS